MKFTSALKHTALTLGVLTGLGLAAACDGDSPPLAVEPGDYEGVGVYIIDDFEDEERGFIYFQVTVNDDGSVEGSGEVYQPTYYEDEAVPDGDDSLEVTGTVTADGISLDLEGGITGEGSVSGGVISVSFGGTTEEGDIEGQLALTAAWDSETGIACGEFNTDSIDADIDGYTAFLLGEDGDFIGAFIGDPQQSNASYAGVAEGTFDAGVNTCDATCGGGAEGTVTGESEGEGLDYDLEAGTEFYPAEGDGSTWAEFYSGYLSNDDFEGEFEVDTQYCTNGSYD